MSLGTGRPTAAPNYPDIPGCRVIEVAGQGGMGTVYKAEQASPRRIVAVKVLNQAASNPESLAAFHHEAETIARLEHPNILPVYGFGEAGGRPYLVLRYLGGGSVAMRLRQEPIELSTAVRWVRAVAGALDYAHGHGLVHRDVKPSNILLDEAGNAYLTDFGIAAALAATGSESVTGSAAYMSPEQAGGQPPDKRSDLYSLAVSLFEMLTGQPPYTAETPLGLIVRHINDPIPSARTLNPNIPPVVDALIQRGMAKNPAGRPASAGEFAGLLEKAAAQASASPSLGAMSVPPTLVVPPPPPLARRGGAGVLLWVGAGLAVLCGLGVLALGGGSLALALLGGPRSTPTAAASATPPRSATANPSKTPEGLLLADDFSDPHSGFGVRQSDADGGIAYAEGALRISVLTQGVEWYSPSGRIQAQDVRIDVDARQQLGPLRDEFGAICRWQDGDNFTAFAISGEGQFKIWQKTGGTVLPVDWTDAPSIANAAAAAQHLTMICQGPQLSLAVNGTVVGKADDSAPATGDVALFAGLRDMGQVVVEFTNLRVALP